MSFQIGKTIFRQKKPHFSSPPPVKWISGTPFSLPSPPLPLLRVLGIEFVGRSKKNLHI
ncbi:hypothetical protein Hanom_Chr14g01264001 [Helianthus anomalus]